MDTTTLNSKVPLVISVTARRVGFRATAAAVGNDVSSTEQLFELNSHRAVDV